MNMYKLKQKLEPRNLRQSAMDVLKEAREAIRHPGQYTLRAWRGSRYRGWRRVTLGAHRLKIFTVMTALVMMLVMPLFTGRSYASTVGPYNPTAAATATNGTSTNWTSATNVYAADGTYASVSLASGATSYFLKATGYGFSIPSAATITGVTAVVQKYYNNTSSAGKITDASVKLLKASAGAGTTQATATTWPTSNSTTTYGSSSSLWGATLAPSDVNNAGFGVEVSAKNVLVSGSGATLSAFIDNIAVTVYYTVPFTYTQASYRLFNNQDAGATLNTNFSSEAIYNNGRAPIGMVSADFNTDGKMDVASINNTDCTASIHLSPGTGDLTAYTDISLTGQCGSLAVADINGDGKPDLVVAGVSTSFGVLLNTTSSGSTTPTFGATTSFVGLVGSAYSAVTTSDINGDGKPDVALVDGGNGLVGVFMNTTTTNASTPTFVSEATFTGVPATSTSALTSSDLNGDGKPDLAVTGGSAQSSVGVLLDTTSNGSSTATYRTAVSFTVGTYPISIKAADFNGDSKLDLAVVNRTSGTVSILLNTAANGASIPQFSLQTTFSVGTSPTDEVVGDFNQDGKPDIAVSSSGFLYVLLDTTVSGASTPTFSSQTYTLSVNGYTTALDLNGDTKLDIVVGTAQNLGFGAVHVFLNTSSVAIGVGTPLAAQNTATTVPGDGQPFRLRMDIAEANGDLPAGGEHFKLQYAPKFGSCDTNFQQTQTSSYSDVTDTSTVRYYDNPLAANGSTLTTSANDPSDGTNTIANGGVIPETYQEKGTTTFTNPTTIPTGKDGMWDFALTTHHTTGGQHYCLRIVKSDGTVLNAYTTLPEIVLPSTTYNQAAYRFYSNQDASNAGGAVSFGNYTDYPMGASLSPTVSADFNGDGKIDMATANFSLGLSVFLGNGDGTFGTATSFTAGSQPTGIAVGDFNKDGKPDVVISNKNDNNIEVFLNTTVNGASTPTFSAGTTYATASISPSYMAAADFNGDGNLDLAVLTYGSPTQDFSLFLGTGTGSFNAATSVPLATNGTAILAGDFTGDGKQDVAVLANNVANIEIMPGSGGGTFGTEIDVPIAAASTAFTAGDFNGDGVTDFAALTHQQWTTNYMSIVLGTGGGNFGPYTSSTLGINTSGIAAADFNLDGKLDLAIGFGSNVSIMAGAGDGTFGAGVNFADSAPVTVAAVDVNADNKPDIVSVNAGIDVLLNTTVVPPVDVGSPLAGMDSKAGIKALGTPFRLRMALSPGGSGFGLNGQSFKLQYALKSVSCSVSTYYDVSSTTPVRWYNNPVAYNGQPITANANDPTDGSNTMADQTYQESNNFTNAVSAVYVGDDGLWDFSLFMPTGARPSDICLRAVRSDGTPLDTYTVYPELQFGPTMGQLMRGGKWFDESGVQQSYFLDKY